jgi:hypothetical protein
MARFWFGTQYIDMETGAVLWDRQALPRIEENDTAVAHIGALVVADEFPYTREDFDTPAAAVRREKMLHWGNQECRAYGRWVLGLINPDDDTEHPLVQQHFRRLSIMGLGMGDKALMKRVGASSLADFRTKIGAPVGRQVGLYDHWGPDEYAKYALDLSTRLGGSKPSDADYTNSARNKEGPAVETIRRTLLGTVKQLNELIGFPNVTRMTPPDMVYWGSQVRKANAGIRLTTFVVDILSSRKRGPSTRSIYVHFGSWGAFTEQANEQYERDMEHEARQRKANLALYEEMISSGMLPESAKDLSEAELFALGGKYQLIEIFAPSMTTEARARHADLSPVNFLNSLARSRPGLSAGMIELEAVDLGVFDDIWPTNDGLEYLVVSDEELEAMRNRRMRSNRARKQKDKK